MTKPKPVTMADIDVPEMSTRPPAPEAATVHLDWPDGFYWVETQHGREIARRRKGKWYVAGSSETIGIDDHEVRERVDAAEAAPLGRRPYVLESSLIEAQIRKAADEARDEIHVLEMEVARIERKRDRDVAEIEATAKTELDARQARMDDLRRIVAMDFAEAPVPAPRMPEPKPEPEQVHDALAEAVGRIANGEPA